MVAVPVPGLAPLLAMAKELDPMMLGVAVGVGRATGLWWATGSAREGAACWKHQGIPSRGHQRGSCDETGGGWINDGQ